MYNAARETLRQLWRGRQPASVIVGIMALSIGSCVTVFSIVSAVLLGDWPYDEAGRLAIVWHARPNAPGVIGMSAGDVEMYRASLPAFDAVGAATTRGYNAGDTNPFRITCARMSPDVFPMLGVAADRGRWFTRDEDARREQVVVLSEKMWRARLGADRRFPGGDLLLDAIPHRVIGIMPAPFVFPPEGVQGLSPADCWLPASYTGAELAAPAFNFVLFGRLKDGVSVQQASSEANGVAQKIWSSYPAAVQSRIALEARVTPLIDQVLAASRTPLYLFAAAALLLLLIGCSNVTNLLLTRLDTRRRELAVRASLGATRATLTAQLVLESIALAIAGGLAGTALASGLLALMAVINPAAFPRLADARVDPGALVFAIVCSTAAGLVGGLAPAWSLGSAPRQGAPTERAVSGGFSRQWWRRGLIAFEIALAVLVLALAGVLARSVANLNAVDPGFEPDRLRVFSVALPPAQYARIDQAAAFVNEVTRALSETPGIVHAAAGSAPPIGPAAAAVVAPEGAGAQNYQPAALNVVTPDYAAAAGIALREGRFLEPTDGGSAPRVAVVNETLARLLWPDGAAIGRSILKVGDRSPLSIVGVAGDLRQGGPLRPAAPAIYVPMAQVAEPVTTWHFVVRSGMPAGQFAARVRDVVSRLDATLPAFALRTGHDLLSATVAAQRFNLLVLGVFSSVAVVMALTGVYGVLSHFINQSRRSFGIRQALGATPSRIVLTLLGWAMSPVLLGIVTGVVAASAGVTAIASLLFGVSPGDPSTTIGVAVLVASAAIMTVLPAAVRASRNDVASLLRSD